MKRLLQIMVSLTSLALALPFDAKATALTTSSFDTGTMVIIGILSIPVAAFAAYATYLLVSGKNHTTHS